MFGKKMILSTARGKLIAALTIALLAAVLCLLIAGRHRALVRQPGDLARCLCTDFSASQPIGERFSNAVKTIRTFWGSWQVRFDADGTIWSTLPLFNPRAAVNEPGDQEDIEIDIRFDETEGAEQPDGAVTQESARGAAP